MKNYDIFLYHNENDGQYVAVCPEFFNFILYHETEDELKSSVLHTLSIYTKNPNIGDSDINYIKVDKRFIEQKGSLETMPDSELTLL